jgi:hypothetical protein
MSIMRGRKTASRDKQVIYVEGKQAAVWNVVDSTTGNVFPACVAARVMIFYRSAALRNGIVKLPP